LLVAVLLVLVLFLVLLSCVSAAAVAPNAPNAAIGKNASLRGVVLFCLVELSSFEEFASLADGDAI
jgi:opacity protein-like surface antigen